MTNEEEKSLKEIKLDEILEQNDIKPDYTKWEDSYIDLFLRNEELTPWLLIFYKRFENVPSHLTLTKRKFVGMAVKQYTDGTDTTLIFKKCIFEECFFYSSDNLYMHFPDSVISNSVFKNCDRFLFATSKIISSKFLSGNLNWFYQTKIQDTTFEEVTFSQNSSTAYEQVSIHNCKYLHCEFENVCFQEADLDSNQMFSCKGYLTFLDTTGKSLVFDKNEKMTLNFIGSKISDLHVVRHLGEMTFKRSDLKEVTFQNNQICATIQDSNIERVDSLYNKYPIFNFCDSTVLNWKSNTDQFVFEITDSSLQEVEMNSIKESKLHLQNSKLKFWELSENELEFKIKESHLEEIKSSDNVYHPYSFMDSEINLFESKRDNWLKGNILRNKISNSTFESAFHHALWKDTSVKDSSLEGDFISNTMEGVTLYKISWEGFASEMTLKKTEIDSSLLKIRLQYSVLKESRITQSDWMEASLQSVKIEDSLFVDTNLSNTRMTTTSWNNSTIRQTKMNAPMDSSFEHSLIQDSRIYGTFRHNRLDKVDIFDTKFLGDLLDISAQNCNLLNVSFHDDFLNCHFQDSIMPVSRFYGKILESSFKSCDLSYSSLEETLIERSLFQNCKLHKASFLETRFKDTDFLECDSLDSSYGVLAG